MNQAPSTDVDLPDDVVLSVRHVSKKFCRNLRRSMWYGMQDLGRNLLGLRPSRDLRPETLDHRPVEREEIDHRPWTLDHGPVEKEDLRTNVPRSNVKGLMSKVSYSSESNVYGLESKVCLPSPVLPPLRQDEFWALQDVSFDLKRGETLGLIGLNGSGKTTLLRVLNGVFPPDSGMVTIHGNVGGLIALGAGFHPHMTGRENIFLNGAILGLKKSTIERQLTDIIAFADIGEFIDAPVTTYSSGMSVRLGFAIASVQEPQLLLLDEVLAVGDAGFRRKCYNRIGAMQQNAAVILVSHNIEHITRICTKVLVLDHGRPVFLGPVQEGVGRYTDMGHVKGNEDKPFLSCDAPVLSATVDFDCTTIEWDGNINVCLVADSSSRVTNCSVRCVLYDENEMIVAEWNSLRNGLRIDLQRGRNEIQFSIGAIRLKAGVYAVGLVLHDSGSIAHLVWCYKTQQITVTGDQRGMTAYQLGNKRSSAGAPMGAKAETV